MPLYFLSRNRYFKSSLRIFRNESAYNLPSLITCIDMMNALERRSTFALSSIFALRMLGLFMIIPVFSVVGQSYQYATPALIGLAVCVYV